MVSSRGERVDGTASVEFAAREGIFDLLMLHCGSGLVNTTN